jgi:hypothetical protein
MQRKITSSFMCVLLTASVLLIIVPEIVGAPVNEEWVARYDGAVDTMYVAQAMDVDSSGNTYVTGWYSDPVTATDYVTVAYDTHGNELWLAQYNDPVNNDDRPYDIAVDELSKNVYVTGHSRISNYRFDIATVAYNSTGSQLWVAKYQGATGDGGDVGKAITLDPSGNIIVSGRTYVSGRNLSGEDNWDYITLKYDPNGNKLWEAQYDGPANLFDIARDVTSDSEGNVYVTGSSDSLKGQEYNADPAYATLKYDTMGNLKWVARYNGPGNDEDFADAIIVDSSKNVYVTGYSKGNGTQEDYATVAYDSQGNELWSARYNGGGNGLDKARRIALGPEGNIYVIGRSDEFSSDYDITTVAYDSKGNELWVSSYNGPENGNDGGFAIAVDILGYIYVTGESMGTGTSWDCATIKYDSKGNEIWVQRYNGPENEIDSGFVIGFDNEVNVYVAGWSAGQGTINPYQRLDYLTIKYSQDLSSEAPLAVAGPDQSVFKGDPVDFDGSNSLDFNGTIVSYDWDYGDGSSHGFGATPTHSYVDIGTYDVILTVTDTDGMQGTDTCEITVKIPSMSIDLKTGWNLISLPLIQSDSKIDSALSSISGDYDVINFYDNQDVTDTWKNYNTQKPTSMNDLMDLDHQMGILINVVTSGGTTLVVEGERPSSTQLIPLYAGWNLVGYPSLSSQSRTDGLNNLLFGTHVDAIEAYDSTTQLWEDMGPSDNFEIGKGYWIHAVSECMWEGPL